MFIFSQLPVRSYRPGPIWQPGRKGGFRRKEEEKPKASKHHSSIAPCQILRSGRMAKGIDSTVMEAKPIPANAAPKHHSIKAPQHQSMYLAIRRLQTAGRCWLLAAEGRPQHQSPKASCQILRARACMEDGERKRFHGNGSKANPVNAAPKHHSTKAISCLVPSDRISAENGKISGVPGPGISGRRSCRCMQR